MVVRARGHEVVRAVLAENVRLRRWSHSSPKITPSGIERGKSIALTRRRTIQRSAESWTVSASDADAWGDGGLPLNSGDGTGGGGAGGVRPVGEWDDDGSGNRSVKKSFGSFFNWIMATSIVVGGVYFIGLERGGKFGSLVRLMAVWVWVILRHGPREVYSIISQLFGWSIEGDVDELALEIELGGDGALVARDGLVQCDSDVEDDAMGRSDAAGPEGCVDCTEDDAAASVSNASECCTESDDGIIHGTASTTDGVPSTEGTGAARADQGFFG